MADDTTLREPALPLPPTREERRAARRRNARLTRLPPLYAYSLRGRRQALLVGLLQAVLAVVPVLLLLRLATGAWYTSGTFLWLSAASLGQQALFRRTNLRAGRS